MMEKEEGKQPTNNLLQTETHSNFFTACFEFQDNKQPFENWLYCQRTSSLNQPGLSWAFILQPQRRLVLSLWWPPVPTILCQNSVRLQLCVLCGQDQSSERQQKQAAATATATALLKKNAVPPQPKKYLKKTARRRSQERHHTSQIILCNHHQQRWILWVCSKLCSSTLTCWRSWSISCSRENRSSRLTNRQCKWWYHHCRSSRLTNQQRQWWCHHRRPPCGVVTWMGTTMLLCCHILPRLLFPTRSSLLHQPWTSTFMVVAAWTNIVHRAAATV